MVGGDPVMTDNTTPPSPKLERERRRQLAKMLEKTGLPITDTVTLVNDTIAALVDGGWAPRSNTALVDPHGNIVTIHDRGQSYEIFVTFESAGDNLSMDVLHLDAQHGAKRIAAVINALAAVPEED
jgi:hypothetical protein